MGILGLVPFRPIQATSAKNTAATNTKAEQPASVQKPKSGIEKYRDALEACAVRDALNDNLQSEQFWAIAKSYMAEVAPDREAALKKIRHMEKEVFSGDLIDYLNRAKYGEGFEGFIRNGRFVGTVYTADGEAFLAVDHAGRVTELVTRAESNNMQQALSIYNAAYFSAREKLEQGNPLFPAENKPILETDA